MRVVGAVKRLPQVTSASYAAFLPLGMSRQAGTAGKILGHDPNAISVSVFRVEPGLLGTMGIPLRRGRDLTEKEADGATPDGVVINEYLARRLWPGEDPLGKRLALSGEKTTSQVVGMVKNGKYRTLGEGPMAAVFRGTLPAARTLVVRTAGDERQVLDEVRREVPEVDPLMTTTMAQTIGDFMALPAVSGAGHRMAAGSIGNTGRGDDYDRALRSDCVRGVAANPRDRCAHGTGRETERRDEDGDGSGHCG